MLSQRLGLRLGKPLGQRLRQQLRSQQQLKGQLLLECTFCTIQKLTGHAACIVQRATEAGIWNEVGASIWVRGGCVMRGTLVVQFMRLLGSFVGLKDAREAQPKEGVPPPSMGLERRCNFNAPNTNTSTNSNYDYNCDRGPNTNANVDKREGEAWWKRWKVQRWLQAEAEAEAVAAAFAGDVECVTARTLHSNRNTPVATPTGDLAGAKSESCWGRDSNRGKGRDTGVAPPRGLLRCASSTRRGARWLRWRGHWTGNEVGHGLRRLSWAR